MARRIARWIGTATAVTVAASAALVPAGSAAADPAPAPGAFTRTTPGAFSGLVPDGTCAVELTARGGAGGSVIAGVASSNGAGAVITARYPVVPGQEFSGVVGGGGQPMVHSCETLPDHVEWLAQQDAADRPHLLVLDLAVERGPSVDPATVESIVRGGTQVLVLSAMAHPPLVRQVLRAGAAGIVGKRDPEEDIVAAVWSVLGRRRWITPELAAIIAGDDDRPRLSDQEERALILYASGLTLDAVARSLGVKPETAKTYLERVKAKYTSAGRAVRTKADLARVAVADGYLGPDVERPDA